MKAITFSFPDNLQTANNLEKKGYDATSWESTDREPAETASLDGLSVLVDFAQPNTEMTQLSSIVLEVQLGGHTQRLSHVPVLGRDAS